MLRDVLGVIIAGREHSGTTICKRILSNSPSLVTGFECGVLSAPGGIKEFINYEPYFTNFMHDWGISFKNLKNIIELSMTFEEFYNSVRKASSVIVSRTKHQRLRRYNKRIYGSRKNTWDESAKIIDKTPVYIEHLRSVVDKTENVPIIVMRKDPKNFVHSWVKRGHSVTSAINCFRSAYGGENEEIINKNDRIKLVQWEFFAQDIYSYVEEIFAFLGIPYHFEDFEGDFSIDNNVVQANIKSVKYPLCGSNYCTISGVSQSTEFHQIVDEFSPKLQHPYEISQPVISNSDLALIDRELSDFVII